MLALTVRFYTKTDLKDRKGSENYQQKKEDATNELCQ